MNFNRYTILKSNVCIPSITKTKRHERTKKEQIQTSKAFASSYYIRQQFPSVNHHPFFLPQTTTFILNTNTRDFEPACLPPKKNPSQTQFNLQTVTS